MKCPDCNDIITKVIDSRLTEKGYTIRRRRECESCSHRFTTYEYVFPKKIVINRIISEIIGNEKHHLFTI